MALSSHNSAGVYVTETDLSDRVDAAATSIGAIVGPSYKGPVGVRTLITSTKNFIDVFGNPDNKLTFMHYAALAFLQQSQRLWVTRVARNSLYGGLVCKKVGNFNQSSKFTQGYSDPDSQYNFESDELFVIYGKNQGVWNNDLSVMIYPAKTDNNDDNTFYVEIYVKPSSVPAEKFLCSLDNQLDGFGVQLNISEQINRKSKLVSVIQNTEAFVFKNNPKAKIINAVDGEDLAGGSNGDAIRESDIINGWDLYNDPEEVDVNLLINGGYSTVPVQLKMDTVCNFRKDCVAILDMPSTHQNVQDALNYRRNILNLDSTFSAIYSPDLYIADQYNGQKIFVPPSGHIAALYAKTDATDAVWKAPAGMNRGNLDILAVRNTYNQGDRDALDASQINALRVIYGAGIKVWGSSTLQAKASSLSEISVRRLMIMLEKSIALAALYSVFEQNTIYLRSKLEDMASRFLDPIRREGGIYDFNVICDETNNPPEVVAGGDTVLDVYIDPALPVKRIHLNAIVARTGGITFALSQINSSR